MIVELYNNSFCSMLFEPFYEELKKRLFRSLKLKMTFADLANSVQLMEPSLIQFSHGRLFDTNEWDTCIS